MWIRRLSGALVLGSLLAGAGLVVFAPDAGAGSHVFTVRGIAVDVTAETAAAAREKAHAEGHVKAMEKLLARLLPRDEQALLRKLEAREVLTYVQDFQVEDERTSDVRYLASLTFRFKPEPIRALRAAWGVGNERVLETGHVTLILRYWTVRRTIAAWMKAITGLG